MEIDIYQGFSFSLETKIFSINSINYILDSDLAEFYGIETRVLNQTIKRNLHRFDSSFIIQITKEQFDWLGEMGYVKKTNGAGGRSTLPYAFTIEGTVLLCGLLNTKDAIEKAKYVAKEFVRLKQIEIDALKKGNTIYEQVYNKVNDSFLTKTEGDDKYITKEEFEYFSTEVMKFIDMIMADRKVKENKIIGFLPKSLEKNENE